MSFTDKTLRCAGCGAEFVWTAGEQQFFAEKALQHEPRHCRACKARRAHPVPKPQPMVRVEREAVCSACGRVTKVPFEPAEGRPVFCRRCFQHRRGRLGTHP